MDDAHVLSVALLTLGDPATMTGGYLFHRRVAELAPAQNARVRFFSFPAWPFPLPLLAGPSVLHAVARHAPDVVLLDSIAAAFVAPWARYLRSCAPIVGMLHQPPGGIDHGPGRRWLQAALDRRAYRYAVRLLAASEDLADQLVADGIEPQWVSVVAPGRDVAPCAAPAPTDLRKGRKAAVLSVGNWVARKGVLDLVEAVARLPPDAVTLHLVGDTTVEPRYAARVEARISAPDLRARVVVHGPLPVSEVAGLYEAADVFALASLTEPYGTVYGEAMAAGLPVVGWAAGNLPHLARDGVEGRVISPGDHAALADSLWQLADDEALRRRLGEAARRRARGFPTWDDTARMLFSQLRAVVDPAS